MRIPLLALLATGVILACTSPTTLCGCSPAPIATVIVSGTVRTVNDAPLSGAVVAARNSMGHCPVSNQTASATEASTLSDSAGRYWLPIGDFVGTADSLCVQVVARRSASTSADTLVSAMVALQWRRKPPYDSARIDVRFP